MTEGLRAAPRRALLEADEGEDLTMMNTTAVWNFITTEGGIFGLKVIGALAAWVIGRLLIRWIRRFVRIGLDRTQNVDPTLTKYLVAILGMVLNVILVLAILDMFGVQTTSFAAMLAGAGLAIGIAWGGLLQHFAAGVFLQFMRPFAVGDLVTIGGVTGTVRELGLFGTTLVLADNTLMLVGNNKVLNENIQNLSRLGLRRVEVLTKVANGVDTQKAIELIKAEIIKIPNVSTMPPPSVEFVQFTPEGPQLAVRPFAEPGHFGQVMFDTHAAVLRVFGTAGFPTPETPLAYRAFSSEAAPALN